MEYIERGVLKGRGSWRCDKEANRDMLSEGDPIAAVNHGRSLQALIRLFCIDNFFLHEAFFPQRI